LPDAFKDFLMLQSRGPIEARQSSCLDLGNRLDRCLEGTDRPAKAIETGNAGSLDRADLFPVAIEDRWHWRPRKSAGANISHRAMPMQDHVADVRKMVAREGR
jgi:hypothetical protein